MHTCGIIVHDQELNTSGASAALGCTAPSQRKEVEERTRLVELVKLQARELDAIKAEINVLRYGVHMNTRRREAAVYCLWMT